MSPPLAWSGRSRAVALLASLAVAIGCGAPARDLRPAGGDAAPVAKAEVDRTHEITFEVPGAPADRDALAVHADVVGPSGGRTRVPGFALERGFAVRVRPRERGVHRYTVTALLPGGALEVAAGTFRAEGRGAPGQVLVRGGALALEDGTPFHALGESRFNVYDPGWSDGLSIDAYVARMAADGMNTIRVFVLSACGEEKAPPRPGCLEPSLGRFDPFAARQYDAILDAGERHGVKVVLSIFAAGFTSGDPRERWEANPYSAARAGPADAPNDFFTAPAAREAARRRLRYAIARWSASPALLSIELINAPERDGGLDERAWIPWARDLARTAKAEDPYGHPVTAGPVGPHWNVVTDERAWWAAPECDIVQWQRHGPDVHDVHDLARELVATTRDTRQYGKPVLVGDFAWGGEAKPLYDHTHVGIWAATFAGAGALARSAPPSTEDSDEPMTPERARHFRVLARFLREVQRAGAVAPAADPDVSLPGGRALALASEGVVALWVHAPRDGYGAPVSGARVTVRGLGDGRWRVRWVDDVTGEPIGKPADVDRRADGSATVDAPAFVRHVAGVVERVERSEEQRPRRPLWTRAG